MVSFFGGIDLSIVDIDLSKVFLFIGFGVLVFDILFVVFKFWVFGLLLGLGYRDVECR